MITLYLIMIMLFMIAVGLFGCLCYLMYEGIKYVYDEVVDAIEHKKDERRREKAYERWMKLEEEEKKQAENELKGRFVYAK